MPVLNLLAKRLSDCILRRMVGVPKLGHTIDDDFTWKCAHRWATYRDLNSMACFRCETFPLRSLMNITFSIRFKSGSCIH
ncbi:hypothetical protein ABIE12_001233 [Serratia sp. 509]